MKIGSNLKCLRKRLGKSQEEVATTLGLTRSSYSGYENGIAQPGIDQLILFSDYYKVPIDELIKSDLQAFSDKEWERYELASQTDVGGKQLRVLTTVVDSNNEELIEMIPMKASAGYTTGFSDPEYLRVLPTFYLPFLSRNKKYRSFPIQGDSMPPVVEGSQVIGEYIQDWTAIRSGTPCIVVLKEEGIVFKVVHNHLAERKLFVLQSTNPFYTPYEVKADAILEMWKFVNYISPELPDVKMDDNLLTQSVRALQKEVHDLKSQLSGR